MATRVSQTTEERVTDEAVAEPLNVTFSALDDRGVQMFIGPRGVWTIPSQATVTPPSWNEMMWFSTAGQSLQSAQQQQLALLQDLNNRVARLEDLMQTPVE